MRPFSLRENGQVLLKLARGSLLPLRGTAKLAASAVQSASQHRKTSVSAVTLMAAVVRLPNPFCGGDEEDRTPDPLRARQVLSQLSYTPIIKGLGSVFAYFSRY